jgi:hypothetical protein
MTLVVGTTSTLAGSAPLDGPMGMRCDPYMGAGPFQGAIKV